MESDAPAANQPNRRSIRLPFADYARPGAYFVTICATQRRFIFSWINEGQVEPTPLGKIVLDRWAQIPSHFAGVSVNNFVLMPNHVHGIIAIGAFVGARDSRARSSIVPTDKLFPRSLGAIIGSFKAIVARGAHRELRWSGPIWQRNYFERVLRDGKEFDDAILYIRENPRKWEFDRENPQRVEA